MCACACIMYLRDKEDETRRERFCVCVSRLNYYETTEINETSEKIKTRHKTRRDDLRHNDAVTQERGRDRDRDRER